MNNQLIINIIKSEYVIVLYSLTLSAYSALVMPILNGLSFKIDYVSSEWVLQPTF